MSGPCGCEESVALRLLRAADEKELSQLHVRQCELNDQALALKAELADYKAHAWVEMGDYIVVVKERVRLEAELAKYTADVPDDHCGIENVARWVREYKAKMPAGNIFDSNGQLVTEGGEVFTIDMEEFEELRAELAKAWEAAAQAQWQHDIDSHQKLCQCKCPDPSLVQPPGGKAK